MLLPACGVVSTETSAEEVVQDTWLAIVRGIDGLQGQAALRTWVYRILVGTVAAADSLSSESQATLLDAFRGFRQ